MMDKNLKNERNYKSISGILRLTLMLFIVSLLCGLIVSIAYVVTSPIIEKTETKIQTESFAELGILNYQNVTETDIISFIAEIEEVYIGVNLSNETVYAFKVVVNSNYVRKINSIIVINAKDEKIENIKVSSRASKYGLDQAINFDIDLVGCKLEDVDDKYNELTALSKLHTSVRKSVEIAYEQFYMITGGIVDEQQK